MHDQRTAYSMYCALEPRFEVRAHATSVSTGEVPIALHTGNFRNEYVKFIIGKTCKGKCKERSTGIRAIIFLEQKHPEGCQPLRSKVYRHLKEELAGQKRVEERER